MPRVLRQLPLLALALATSALFYAGFALRDPASAQRDRQKRRDFAVAVQRGEMPRVPARNVGGALRQEIEAQDAAAAARARLAMWLQVAAAVSLVGLGLAIAVRTSGRDTESSAAAA